MLSMPNFGSGVASAYTGEEGGMHALWPTFLNQQPVLTAAVGRPVAVIYAV